jgi:lipopolysaccharide assembly outer membrane protein LptD (OstA)
MITIRFAAISLLLIATLSVSAQTPSRITSATAIIEEGLTLEIGADRMSKKRVDDENALLYQGRAEISLKDCNIKSESLTLFPASNRLIAEGNVLFTKGDQTIKALRIEWEYKKDPNKITVFF